MAIGDSVHISGADAVGGGEYENISISGLGKVTSDVKCQSLTISGSGHICGNVECSGEFKIAGSGKVDGSLKCGSCHIAGSAKFESIESEGEVKFAGSVSVSGSVKGKEVKIAGSSKIDGDLSGERIVIGGETSINGLLNGDEIRVYFEKFKVSEIGGGIIEIVPKKEKKFLGVLRRSNAHLAEIGTIEGDEISLELVRADVVRGANIKIGDGCEIGKVEYSENIEISENAHVDYQMKI